MQMHYQYKEANPVEHVTVHDSIIPSQTKSSLNTLLWSDARVKISLASQALPVADALKRASLRESLACEAK